MIKQNLALLFFLVTNCFAQSHSFPTERSEVAITFPENWVVTKESNFLQARADNEGLQFLLIRFDEGISQDTALGFLDGFVKDMTLSQMPASAEEMSINGMYYTGRYGMVKVSESVDVMAKSYVLTPFGLLRYGIIYFYPPENKEKGESRLKEILFSIFPILQ